MPLSHQVLLNLGYMLCGLTLGDGTMISLVEAVWSRLCGGGMVVLTVPSLLSSQASAAAWGGVVVTSLVDFVEVVWWC
jgi:hypothetical protein